MKLFPPSRPPVEKNKEDINFHEAATPLEQQPMCAGVHECLLMPWTDNPDLVFAGLVLKAPEHVLKRICSITGSDIDVVRRWAQERINDS